MSEHATDPHVGTLRTLVHAVRTKADVERLEDEGEQLLKSLSPTDAEDRTLFVASTPSVDRPNDIVAADWLLENYKLNPVVMWAHQYHLPPVGRAVSVQQLGNVLALDVQWDMEGPQVAPGVSGRELARLYREGWLNANSVGFIPHKQVHRSRLPDDDPRKAADGWLLSGNELLEDSAVPIPANRDALAVRSIPRLASEAEILEAIDRDPALLAAVRQHLGAPQQPELTEIERWWAGHSP